MKLTHLRDFVAIAERGGLRAASRQLGQAQPALTRSLGELERELGAPLFERHVRGMTLTAMGHVFALRANAILNEVRRAKEEVEQLRGGNRGSLVVALSMAAHMALLPAALPAFRDRYPAVQLRIIEGFYPTSEAGLRDGSIDFYVGPEPGRTIPSELRQETLFENVRVVLCRKGHPLATAQTLAELAHAEWATTSITVEAEAELDDLFAVHGLGRPRLALQCQSALTLLVALAHTDLLAVLPQQWLQFGPAIAVVRPICVRETLPAPAMVTIRRAGVPLTPAAIHLADLLSRSVPNDVGK